MMGQHLLQPLLLPPLQPQVVVEVEGLELVDLVVEFPELV
jgi:hypothetical protein